MNYGEIKTHDIANGVGVRVSLFVSGCPHHCKGCFNQETWDKSYGNEFTSEQMQLIIRELGHSYINGFSLLGGEPLAKYNIKDCENILALVKSHFPYKTVWVYSGYRFEEVRKLHIMKYIDVLVDGRFKESKKDLKLRFKGSSNQRVIDVQESLRKSKLILMESYNGY